MNAITYLGHILEVKFRKGSMVFPGTILKDFTQLDLTRKGKRGYHSADGVGGSTNKSSWFFDGIRVD